MSFFERSNNAYSLRGHEYKIAVRRSIIVARSANASSHLVTSYPAEEVVNATSINMFKNRLDRCNEWDNWKTFVYQARFHQVSSNAHEGGYAENAVVLFWI